MLMAYANPYYDPVKAHEYYMRTRKLKGYENRYGGSRGDGTSAASSGFSPSSKPTTSSTGRKTYDLRSVQKKNQEYNDRLSNLVSEQYKKSNENINKIGEQVKELQKQINSMSGKDKKKNKQLIADQISSIRKRISTEREGVVEVTNSMKKLRKGGSISGLNQKGLDEVQKIKNRIENEHRQIIEQTNKDIDKNMLKKARNIQAYLEQARKRGERVSKQQFLNKIRKLTKEAKGKKEKSIAEQRTKYRMQYMDEIDKLRKDETLYRYYDKK